MQMAIDCRTRPFTVGDYRKMYEVGIFGETERTELIDGSVFLMPPIKAGHNSAVLRLSHVLIPRLDGRALVQIQGSVELSQYSAPQPDIALLSPRADYYETALPTPIDVFAIVEVSGASLDFDRGRKMQIYARSGIREYWIVNLAESCIERYQHPHDIAYRSRTLLDRGDCVSFEAFSDVEFAVEELLGPTP
jgi:Uma2 family endonuclease